MRLAMGFESIQCIPGIIDTPIWTKISACAGATRPSARTRWPEPRCRSAGLDKAQDIANGVLFLASDASRYMTSAELVIDGGMTGGARPRWSSN